MILGVFRYPSPAIQWLREQVQAGHAHSMKHIPLTAIGADGKITHRAIIADDFLALRLRIAGTIFDRFYLSDDASFSSEEVAYLRTLCRSVP